MRLFFKFAPSWALAEIELAPQYSTWGVQAHCEANRWLARVDINGLPRKLIWYASAGQAVVCGFNQFAEMVCAMAHYQARHRIGFLRDAGKELRKRGRTIGRLEALAELRTIISWDVALYLLQAADSQEYRALQEAASKTFPEATRTPLHVPLDQELIKQAASASERARNLAKRLLGIHPLDQSAFDELIRFLNTV